MNAMLILFLIAPAMTAVSPAVEPALRLEQAYLAAWNANDRRAVMATMASDAVIIPSGGAPIAGTDSIERFWFPDDGSRTEVTSYETVVDGARAEGDVAWIWGRGRLSFTWQKGEERIARTQQSTFTMIARRGKGGEWRIVHRAWTEVKG